MELKNAALKGDGGHTIGAVARYDVEYIKYYTGIKATLVSSYGGVYFDNNLYKVISLQVL